MSEPGGSFIYQASFTIPSGEQYEKGDMVNIRGSNPQEFYQALDAFNDHMAEKVAQVASAVRAHYLATRDLGAQTIEVERNQGQQYPQNGAQQPQGDPWGNPSGGGQNGPQNGPQQGQQQGGWNGPQGGTSSPPPQGGGQQPGNGVPTEPPPHVGPAPECSHGTKRFLAKPYKNGKPGYWMAWACPAQRGDNTQHDLEFIRQGNG